MSVSGNALLAVLCALPLSAAAQLAAPQTAYRTDQILVKPKGGVDDLALVHAFVQSQTRKAFPRFGNLEVVTIPPGAHIEDVIEAYQESGLVEYAEPDYFGAAASVTPNDPGFSSLWGFGGDAASGAAGAWDFRFSAEPVVVAVIDSGIRATHEDLALNMWRNPGEIAGNSVDDDSNGYVDDVHGINAITGSGDPSDDDTIYNGHGTHVAGTIGAAGNNGKGVVGVAWRVRFMACKWITSTNTGSTSDAIECIDYAIAKGAQIINASWYITGFSQALLDAIRSAGNHGIIVVAAAGNTNTATGQDIDVDSNARYPAAYDADNIVSVGALTPGETPASYSSFGKVRVDFFAPGGDNTGSPNDIYSTGRVSDTDYRWLAGTSMAAAHASGAFALIKAQFPHDSYLQLINRVFSAVNLDYPVFAGKCQNDGTLDVRKAVTSFSSSPRNDAFAKSYEIEMPSGQAQITATGNNVDATRETGEPSYHYRSVWWHWTPADDPVVEIRTQGSTFNTRLAVYTGSSVSSLTLVASNAVTDGCSWSRVSFTSSVGTTYRIAVDGYDSAVGSIKLTMRIGSATTQTTIGFDRSTLQRTSGQFSARITGPANQNVTLDRLSSTQPYWTNHASFTLSGSGIYDYTDSSATNSHQFYRCQASSLKSCNAVGYVGRVLSAGQSMIANPLNRTDNRLPAVLPTMPDGTYLYKWDDVSQQYQDANAFVSGYGWVDTNMTLAPGEGAIIDLPSATTNFFVGEYLQGYLINPVSAGFSIRASKPPVSGPVASGLRAPIVEGDLIMRMVSGSYQTFAYRNGMWINDSGSEIAEPVIAVGESFWIVKPVAWEQIFSVWP